jgi:hypothetical protein
VRSWSNPAPFLFFASFRGCVASRLFLFFPLACGCALDNRFSPLRTGFAQDLEFLAIQLVVGDEKEFDLRESLFVQVNRLQIRRRLFADSQANQSIVAGESAILTLFGFYDAN